MHGRALHTCMHGKLPNPARLQYGTTQYSEGRWRLHPTPRRCCSRGGPAQGVTGVPGRREEKLTQRPWNAQPLRARQPTQSPLAACLPRGFFLPAWSRSSPGQGIGMARQGGEGAAPGALQMCARGSTPPDRWTRRSFRDHSHASIFQRGETIDHMRAHRPQGSGVAVPGRLRGEHPGPTTVIAPRPRPGL
jgi:hypothetical protein